MQIANVGSTVPREVRGYSFTLPSHISYIGTNWKKNLKKGNLKARTFPRSGLFASIPSKKPL